MNALIRSSNDFDTTLMDSPLQQQKKELVSIPKNFPISRICIGMTVVNTPVMVY